jgi:hypothetical protein
MFSTSNSAVPGPARGPCTRHRHRRPRPDRARAGSIGQHAHAADVDDQRAGAREERGDLQRRNGAVTQIEQRGDVAVGQALAGQDRNRDRRFLQVFLALLRGHHDFESCPPPPGASASGLCASAAGAAWSSGRGQRRRGQQGGQHKARGAQRQARLNAIMIVPWDLNRPTRSGFRAAPRGRRLQFGAGPVTVI